MRFEIVTKFYIGGGTAAGAFGGFIDDVRVYNYAMTAAEIAAISPRPMLPDPTDGQTNVMFDTNLKWNPGDGSSKYKVYFSDALDPDPNIWLLNPTVVDTTVPDADTGINLKLGTQYWWYVQEYDGADSLLWTSDLWNFTVRVLDSDVDDDDVVNLNDFAGIAGRWLADVRGTPGSIMIDTCVYDPNNTDRNDPASYAYHWDTYYTYTGGNLLYGTGTCVAVEDPNLAIKWHYDTPSSTGGTDTDFIYWHTDRPRLPLNQFEELRMEVKAAPGSVLKDPWWGANDKDGDGIDYVIPVGILGDNQWHDLVIPLSTLSGIQDMDDMEYIHCGIWGPSVSGTWYIRNMRVLNNEGTLRCISEYYIPEDVNFDCFVNLQDIAIMANEWMLDARNP